MSYFDKDATIPDRQCRSRKPNDDDTEYTPDTVPNDSGSDLTGARSTVAAKKSAAKTMKSFAMYSHPLFGKRPGQAQSVTPTPRKKRRTNKKKDRSNTWNQVVVKINNETEPDDPGYGLQKSGPVEG